jgi:hypothetical protein
MQGMDVILVSVMIGLFLLAMALVVCWWALKVSKKLNIAN